MYLGSIFSVGVQGIEWQEIVTAYFWRYFLRVLAHFSAVCVMWLGVQAFMFLRFKIVSVGATMAHI